MHVNRLKLARLRPERLLEVDSTQYSADESASSDIENDLPKEIDTPIDYHLDSDTDMYYSASEDTINLPDPSVNKRTPRRNIRKRAEERLGMDH